MRANLFLPDDLHAAFRKRCEWAGVPMSEVIRAYMEIEVSDPMFTARKWPNPEPAAKRSTLAAERAARRDAVIACVNARDGRSQAEIAAEFGITPSGVSRIISRSRNGSRD